METTEKVTFYYDVSHLSHEVENLTATIASRPYGKENMQRPYLIFSEDQAVLFQRLLKDAIGDIRASFVHFITPEHPSDDLRNITRVHIHTCLKVTATDEGIPSIVRALDDKIREYLIWQVVRHWLAMKAPDELQWVTERVDRTGAEITNLFRQAKGKARRKYMLW
jgi:hypothetical protein